MRTVDDTKEIPLLLACALLLAASLLAPAVAQPAGYYGLADQRELWGLPNAMDVLSNLPFAMAGVLGGFSLWRLPARSLSNVQRAMASLFFAGLFLTAPASAWYHLQPDDAGLAVDRCAMAIAFAGLLGLAAAGRVSERSGALLGLALLLLGPLSVHVWKVTGNALPWGLLQFGGMALIAWMGALRPGPRALDIRWGAVIVAYGVAKLLELNDAGVYAWSGHLASGHTFKHVAAALAAWPVIAAIMALRRSRQNATGPARIARIESRRREHA